MTASHEFTSTMNSTSLGATTGSVPNIPAALHLPGRHLKLPEVLGIIPVSSRTWYDGMNSGMHPKPACVSKCGVALV